MSKRDAALAWAARGFRVFPIIANSKHPAIERFYDEATTDPAKIRQWWSDLYGNERDYNIGVSTTGFVVVDLDTKDGKNGVAAYEGMGGDFGTLIVRTPSGGFHCYYRAGDFANTQGDRGGLAPGVDTRSRHGYVLAPGSSIDGVPYEIARDAAPAALPAAVDARLRHIENERVARRRAALDVDAASAEAFALQYLRDRAPVAIEGTGGDETTYRVACAARDYGVDEETCFELMAEHWNERCEPPWSLGELRSKVENAYRYGQNQGAVRHPAHLFSAVKIEPVPEPKAPEPAKPIVVDLAAWGNVLPQTQLARRPWVFHGFLLRQDVTTLIAAGGVGKTQLTLYAAIMLALGRDLLRYQNEVGRKRSLVYDVEETHAELSMRLHAQCLLLNIDPAEVTPYIRLVSGQDHGDYMIARGGQRSPVVMEEETCKALIEAAKQADVAMIAFNPLIAMHEAPENDNTAMRAVLKICQHIARQSNAGLLLAHHTSKGIGNSTDGYAGSPDAGRGAGSVRDAARVSITMMAPTERDRESYGLSPDEAHDYLRVDDAKANKNRASTKASWMRKEGVKLLCGEIVGAFAPVDLHSRSEVIRIKLCEAIVAGIREAETGSVSIDAAAKILRDRWPLFADMDTRAVKARVERALREPLTIDDGTTIRITVSDLGRRVVLE